MADESGAKPETARTESLPTLEVHPDDRPAGCPTPGWLTPEETAAVATLHALRRELEALRTEQAAAPTAARAAEIRREIEALRRRRQEIVRRREAAYRDKMIRLGHAER